MEHALDRATGSQSGNVCELSAVELVARMRRKEISAREVVAAHLARIEKVNPTVNAIVTLVAERALADAARADEVAARGGPLGALHGLPVAHKDLVDTAGIWTTLGSPFFRDNVPTRDALIVTRMRAAGAITCGKTNTPEFGAGSQTFNTVFGATRNPYDTTKALTREAVAELRAQKAPESEAYACAVRALVSLRRTEPASKEIDRALGLLRKSENRLVRLPVMVDAARVRAASGEQAGARRMLQETLVEAEKLGLIGIQLDARLALGELDVRGGSAQVGRARLAALEKEATTRGFHLVARPSAALQRGR